MDDIPRTKPGEILADLPMRAAATVFNDVSGKNSMSDRTEQTQEQLELDSLIGSDEATEIVSLPHGPAERDVRIDILAET